MRKIKEVLRLKWSSGLSNRKIARACSISRTAVASYVRRAESAGLKWPLPESVTDTDLEVRLFGTSPGIPGAPSERPAPNWQEVHRELQKWKHLTLKLIWEEYLGNFPNGLGYSQFCWKYREWRKQSCLAMRMPYKAGEMLFVDYAGETIAIVDPKTGKEKEAQIFVGVLGASNYTYAEATWGQTSPEWLDSHEHAFHFFGGVPEITVPDNLKSAVTKANRYEPDLNPAYQDFAVHYGTAILPARVRKPRDKAKVENGVLQVERWILARLRNRRFFSLREANEAIAELVMELNEKPFQKREGSRRSEFERLDRSALRPLPNEPFETDVEWKKAKAHVDYHIEVKGHFYSVPHAHVGHRIEVRITRSTVEGFYRGQRIMSHQRSHLKGGFTTIPDHMPPNHRWVSKWHPERFLKWAGEIGPHVAELVHHILKKRQPVQQGYRSCLGILNLKKSFSAQRLDAACARALAIGGSSYRSVRSILEKGLDRQMEIELGCVYLDGPHENIRGSHYYTTPEGGVSC